MARHIRRLLVAVTLVVAWTATTDFVPFAGADVKGDYSHAWYLCHNHSSTPSKCGPNLRRAAVSVGRLPDPTLLQGHLKRLKQLNTPPPRPQTSGLAQCIITVESHGNPQANNGSHFGIAQWSIEAWTRMKGTQFAPTPLGATYDQQVQVLNYGLAHYGCNDWCPYDPC